MLETIFYIVLGLGAIVSAISEALDKSGNSSPPNNGEGNSQADITRRRVLERDAEIRRGQAILNDQARRSGLPTPFL